MFAVRRDPFDATSFGTASGTTDCFAIVAAVFFVIMMTLVSWRTVLRTYIVFGTKKSAVFEKFSVKWYFSGIIWQIVNVV